MMWAIFCSLAFCTFQMVFADTEDLQDDMYSSSLKAVNPLMNIDNKAEIDFAAAAKAVKIKEMRWDEILERCRLTDFQQRFITSYNNKFPKCYQCYDKAKNTKDLQTADECCKKQIAQFKIDAKVYLVHGKACIAKCAQDGSKCREELTNIKKKEMEENKKAYKDHTKNV